LSANNLIEAGSILQEGMEEFLLIFSRQGHQKTWYRCVLSS